MAAYTMDEYELHTGQKFAIFASNLRFLETNVLLFYSDNKEHNSNQLTVINAHVGYVLFTVVMTTFTVAPSSGVPYADALLPNLKVIDR